METKGFCPCCGHKSPAQRICPKCTASLREQHSELVAKESLANWEKARIKDINKMIGKE